MIRQEEGFLQDGVEIRSVQSDQEDDLLDPAEGQLQIYRSNTMKPKAGGRIRKKNESKAGNGTGGDEKKLWKYLDIEEEEQRDQDAVKLILIRNQKMVKYLFQRCGSHQVSQSLNTSVFGSQSQPQSYQQIHQKNSSYSANQLGDKTIQITEITKLLRDLGISQHQVSKNELAQLIAHINRKRKVPNLKEQKVDFDGFTEMLIEISHHFFSDNFKVEPQKCLIELMKLFVSNSQKSHQPMPLPPYQQVKDEIGIQLNEGQREKVKMLERILVRQPNYVLPEGYSQYKELNHVSTYKVPQSYQIQESQRISLELIDEILFGAVGIHFLEPLKELKQVAKVRPKFQHGRVNNHTDDLGHIIRSAEPQSRRARSERRLSPLRSHNTSANQSSILPSTTNSTLAIDPTSNQLMPPSSNHHRSARPPLPLASSTSSKAPKNRAMHKRLQEQERELEFKQQRDVKFRKRQEAVKRALSEQRAARMESSGPEITEELQRAKEEEEKARARALRERQIMMKKQVEEQIERRKLEQEKEMKEKEEAERREKRERSRAAKEFVMKQKVKLQGQFEAKKQQRIENEKIQIEEKQRMLVQKEKAKGRADKYYQEHTQDLREQELQEKEQLRQLLHSNHFQQVLKTHYPTLQPIFRQFATQDKKQEIGKDDKIIAMNSTEFIKLCKQHGVSGIGKDLTNEDVIQVFRTVMRDRQSENTEEDKSSNLYTSIEYNDFELAMLRMHVLANGPNNSALKPSIDHSQRILKQINGVSPQSFDNFLGKFETKSLKGYATNKPLKQDPSQITVLNQDLSGQDPFVEQDLQPTTEPEQSTVKKEISKKIEENARIKVNDLDKMDPFNEFG